ncbi:putative bifunctional diguanylate cyclase/phosphodiesterase [Butyrivibrio sp. NC2002]|uniref:putative bifunctional diguanylate cyclase/phosphodiesterase n=1 Tax=Butyrivibrio sp. NC2002 TaxID=1410610 RepID=UPI00068A8D10|nr:GGDEF domain-containing phosphodiesterase [Butyrivibrio sp. NC2002]
MENILQPGNERMVHYLTGLPNAGGYLQNIIMLSKTTDLKNYTAFYFNLKGFATINQRYGMDVGDRILIQFTAKVSAFLLEDELLGHLGGDNFVAMIKKERKGQFCALLSGIEISFKVGDKTEKVQICATLGVWDIDREVKDHGEIIGRPSVALQHAKHILHQPVVEVTEDMMKRVAMQKTVLESYQKALEEEEFLVYYQPKVNSKKQKLVGAEGLVRWMHNGEMVSPGVFIPPLEQNGDILHLDYYVLKKVCRDIKEWIEEGVEPVPVSVNFSRKDLIDTDLAKNIDNIITESGIDKKYIEIEVTETVDEQEHGELATFISTLYKNNIMTAIDDFGAGYSSLATLRQFQVHTLKIDRSFINTDDFSWKDEIILTDVIHMAKQLGMDIVTEGVEREDQVKFVNTVGCDVIQGFYYDRPLPKDEFRKRLVNKEYKL